MNIGLPEPAYLTDDELTQETNHVLVKSVQANIFTDNNQKEMNVWL